MSKKVIIFDLDDTLILEKDYVKSGFEIISKELEKQLNINSNEIYEKMVELFKEDSQMLFNRLLDYYDVDYDKNRILKLIKIYREHKPTINLLPDAKEILNYLFKNNYRMGIITDGYAVTQRRKLEVLKIDKYFEHIIVTDELGKENWKPSEVPYKLMKDKMNIKFDEMIYVGDNPKKDFISPNKLGMDSIQIIRDDGIYRDEILLNSHKAKKYIKKLCEIKELI